MSAAQSTDEGPLPDTDLLVVPESCTGEPMTPEQADALWDALKATAEAHDHKMRRMGPYQTMRQSFGGDMARLALEYATARLAREARGEVLCTDTGCDAKATGWLGGEPWCARHDPRNEE